MLSININSVNFPVACNISSSCGINLALGNCRCRAYINISATVTVAICQLINHAFSSNINCILASIICGFSLIAICLNINNIMSINLRQVSTTRVHTSN